MSLFIFSRREAQIQGPKDVSEAHTYVPPSIQSGCPGGVLLCGRCKMCKWLELGWKLSRPLLKWWEDLLLLSRAILNTKSKECQLVALLIVSVEKEMIKLTWSFKSIPTRYRGLKLIIMVACENLLICGWWCLCLMDKQHSQVDSAVSYAYSVMHPKFRSVSKITTFLAFSKSKLRIESHCTQSHQKGGKVQ